MRERGEEEEEEANGGGVLRLIKDARRWPPGVSLSLSRLYLISFCSFHFFIPPVAHRHKIQRMIRPTTRRAVREKKDES